MNRLVLIGKDPAIGHIGQELVSEGFLVQTASDGLAGLAKLKRTVPDLLIVELSLPDIHGKHVCRYVREDDLLSRLPILLLTTPRNENGFIAGLDMGADAFVTVPVTVRELVAKIRSLIWRNDPPLQNKLALDQGPLVIDPLSYRVSYLGEPIKMSLLEFRLLYYLASHPNAPFSREQLVRSVWTPDHPIEPRTVDVCIRRLRQKLEKNPENPLVLRTVRGSGYVFVADPRPAAH